jgi:hypothetical protein
LAMSNSCLSDWEKDKITILLSVKGIYIEELFQIITTVCNVSWTLTGWRDCARAVC